MDALLEDQTLQAVLGRADFSGIDNAALDFSQLEEYINDEANNNIYFQENLPGEGNNFSGTTSQLATALLNGSNGNSGAAVLITNGTPTVELSKALSTTPPQVVSADTFLSTYSVANDTTPSVVVVASSATLNLPDSPPDSGSEPPFSPANEADNSKLVSSTSGSLSNGTNGTKHSNELTIQQHQQSPNGVRMENMKHFVDYSNHSHQLNIKLETSLANLPHQMHQPPHTNHLTHHHPHLGPHHAMDTNGQLSLLPPDGSPISAQMVSLSGASIGTPLAVNSSMLHGLVANPTQVHSQSMMTHSNGSHLYASGEDYPSMQAHYAVQATPPLAQQAPSSQQPPTPQASGSSNKKRKVSEVQSGAKSIHNGNSSGNGNGTPTNIYIKQEPTSLSPDSAQHSNGNSSCTSSNNGSNVHSTQQCEDEYFDYGPDSQMYGDSFYQCIRFTAFNPTSCCSLFEVNFKEVTQISYRVDADKGFNFSNADDAFVCQKKNHFQVTVHSQTLQTPVYVKSLDGALHKIEHFYLHFYGVKVESPTQTIKVEQSQSDRSKKSFHPVRIEFNSETVCKMTVGRLHFSETTSNNMRKKGKPNPDQRYFYLVVSLCAHVGDQVYQIAAQASERIIVRASNPGQFENDVELLWQKGAIADTIYHTGKVGINTDRPDESLVVFGNAKVTGSIMQPSDERAKTNIEEVDTRAQLKNVSNMRIVRYEFKPDFAKSVGIKPNELANTGVLAQEVQKILPEAVKETGDIVLPNGQTIENFLVVNKDRIFMENLGAVKELCKVTDNLETRIDELERMNVKLSKFNRFDSIKSMSTSSIFSGGSSNTCSQSSYRNRPCRRSYHSHKSCNTNPATPAVCTNRFIQSVIMILVLVMAMCLISIAALYILEYHRRHEHSALLNPNHQQANTYYGHDNPQYQVPNYHPNVNSHNYNAPHFTPSYQSPYTPNSIGNYKDKKHSHPDSYITPLNTRHPRPTAIPVLKPQVLGIPNGCLDTSSSSPSCPQFCCADENFHSQNVQQELSKAKQEPIDKSYQSKLNDKLTPNETILEKGAHALLPNSSSAPNSPTTSSSAIPVLNTPLSGAPSGLNPGAFFDGSGHSKFSEVNEPPNMKKKRTDKGVSFGKYSGSGIQDIQNMDDDIDSKSSHVHRRRRRETSRSTGLNSQSLSNYPRKDITRTVEFIKLVELNATIDYSYCTKLQCTQGVGSKFHYIVPISKYMDMEYITLQFSLSQDMKVDHCQLKELTPVSCQSGHYDNIPQSYKKGTHHILMPESNPNWRLPIGVYQRSSYVFRILARDIDIDSPCSLLDSQIGSAFVEYKLEFVRKCDK